MKSAGSSTGLAAVLVLALGAPLIAAGAWVFVASHESPLESAATAEPLVGTIEQASRYGEVNVAIKVEQAPALVPATQASGTVTALDIGVGDEVAHGQVVMAVDAKDVVAYTADSPLYRDVSRRLSGPDVEIVQQLLGHLGYLEGVPDGVAGYSTEQAIKAFNEDHGYGKNNTTLSRAALVWLGPEPVVVSEMSVALEDTASPGTELFATTASLARIAVTETTPLLHDGDVELEVAGVGWPYLVGSGAVNEPDAVAAIALALGSAEEGVGTIRLAEPANVGAIPASAVFSDEAGAMCIFPDVAGEPILIEPIGGTLGTVDVNMSLVGQSVLLNPREVIKELTCG